MGRMGTPGQVVYGMVFLASDESSYMTGSELVMDWTWVWGWRISLTVSGGDWAGVGWRHWQTGHRIKMVRPAFLR